MNIENTRNLTEAEEKHIIELYKTEIVFLNGWINFAKIMSIPAVFFLFIFLYNELNRISIFLYLGFVIIISISLIIGMKLMNKFQNPLFIIMGEKRMCFEGKIIDTRIEKINIDNSEESSNNQLCIYYLIIETFRKNIEVEYKGNQFDKLSRGNTMVVVPIRNEKYICFSPDDIVN